ncbi:SusC/RagA family TonB-linked outer membrane protein [Chitinophaga sancti]|uniref:SusC/RagA family TonB-linked outer membrane protein n=1 Tax=Chitinophaga sancti TaxID=1004 RepID=A0A1K1SR13_9BACT|nr:SusC/RagA family TonB-linked outer membrane protein [Chitinophaga sancti]WQD65329.1 SusC/RagA family TonB-linked outer membrane protein [Chitinophaga sancti]WQG89047.1 SusC/RagA family TonB-linked outer membrane protein [Chitinophaga sancti]SFW86856.1 TonB-linked outer membrane protein, SusC/RagA family [Chitinophaga sancti]
MKLTAILTLVFTLQLSAKTYSQTVSISGRHLSLYEVFNTISKQTGYEFVYDAKLLDSKGAVNINAQGQNLSEVLDKCLNDKALTYSIMDKIIVISPKKAPREVAPAPIAATPVTGTVTDSAGHPLQNVSIQVKGTSRGAMTDASGHFSLDVQPTDVLVISYIGFDKQEVTIGANTNLNIRLAESNKQLGTVVVTALGIKRSEKSITYAAQQVSGVELTKAKDPNLMNTLNGKVAGLTISSSSSGVGGSAKVILRGSKSGLNTNQALYVIDGMPMNNTLTNQPNSSYGGSTAYDGGDPISNMNPEDIESISILKGASAAALYGSQGANGVVLITTKSGKAGRTTISYASGFTLSQAAYKPEFQNSYGVSRTGSTQSWGDKLTTKAHNNLDDFFQTGTNATNAISLAGGTEKTQTYFSYANTSARGIQPTNKLGRNNISFKETGKFLNDKLTAEADVNYITQKIDNTPLSGLYFNPLTGLYLYPRGTDLSQYKSDFEISDASRNGLMVQKWPFHEDVQQNPWWILNRNPNKLNRNRLLLNASLKYEINKYLSIQARGSVDRMNDVYDQKLYADNNSYLAPLNGGYVYQNLTTNQQYGDLLLNFNVPFGKEWRVTGVVGGAIRDLKNSGEKFNSGKEGLHIANVFTLNNFTAMNSVNSGTLPDNHSQYQSVFGSANISFKDWFYVDLTARNDWSSNLAFTPTLSYFYPSVGLNVILSSVTRLPEWVSFAKVRGSYAQVGSSPQTYQSYPARNSLGAEGSIIGNTIAPFTDLKPEKTNSLEFGTEWRFFNNRLSVDATYYKTNTKNQTMLIAASWASYYDYYYINAGNIQNQGVEAVVRYDVFRDSKLTWNTGLNFATNQNRIIELAPGVDDFTLTGASGSNYSSKFRVGGSFGDIYGNVLKKDAQGRIVINSDGAPTKQDGGMVKIGNSNTKFQLGWNNNLGYKHFTLSMLIDGKFGGKVMSVTQSMMDQYGVSKVSGDARDAGGVKINGVDGSGNAVTSIDAQKWYTTIGGREAISGEYMYNATTVRLREVALGYTVPLKDIFIKALKFSLTGRNLIYFYKKAPFDPELTMSTANGLSGVDIFMQPALRSYGLSLNATF